MYRVHNDVTAVLVTWWRRDVRPVESYLRGLGCFRDVLVWRNTPQHNRRQYGRYLRMQTVKTPLIYTQDDDNIVHNVPNLLCLHCDENYFGATHYMPQWYRDKWLPRWMPCNLFGWGAVFHKSLLTGIDEYLAVWPNDALFQREVDYIFPGMIPAGMTRTVLGEHTNLPQATNTTASFKNPGALNNLREVTRRVRICRTMRLGKESSA